MRSGQTPKGTSILLIMLMLSVILISPAFSTTVGEITEELACTCGCGMVVSACEGSMECGAAKQITDEVRQMLDKRRSKDEIIQYFVNAYGERILAAPTKKGFNLSAWIFPFFAIVLAGGGIYIFLDRCLASRNKIADRSRSSDMTKITDRKYLDQFEKELKDFEL
ncbi:MAG: cytochrome c-type biogenesis protein CcmH [Pseudomonadota bacterium]